MFAIEALLEGHIEITSSQAKTLIVKMSPAGRQCAWWRERRLTGAIEKIATESMTRGDELTRHKRHMEAGQEPLENHSLFKACKQEHTL